MASYLSKKLSGRLAAIDMVEKEDLDLVTIATKLNIIPLYPQANHLVGIRGTYLKLKFHSVEDLMKAKRWV